MCGWLGEKGVASAFSGGENLLRVYFFNFETLTTFSLPSSNSITYR